MAKTRTRRRRPRPDKYNLYQRSVQEPEADIRLLARVFQNRFGRPPRLLREDFCGTALLAAAWVRSHRENRAWGIDLDPDPLDWGRRHNLAPLRESQRRRVRLLQDDVLRARTPRADLTVAFNFSYFLFKTRPELLRYFRKARTTLRPEGLFVLDAYGGGDAQRTQLEIREHDGFDYVWDQSHFDPITHDVVNHIHFDLPGRRRWQRVFTYHWRLWTLPEIQELLGEAGFRDVGVWWEATDRKTEEGNGVYTRRRHAPDDPAWVAYIVAQR